MSWTSGSKPGTGRWATTETAEEVGGAQAQETAGSQGSMRAPRVQKYIYKKTQKTEKV